MQSKKLSHLEVLANQGIGIIIGWCIVYFIFPLLDEYSQGMIASISTVMFFISSYTRSYLLRRFFNMTQTRKGFLNE